MDFFIPPLIDAGKWTVKLVSSSIGTFLSFEDNIKALQEECSNLTCQKRALENAIDLARLEGKVPTAQVNEWLKKAEESKTEVNQLLEEGLVDEITNRCTLNCNFARYQLSKRVAEKLDEVKKLLEAYCNIQTVLMDRNSPIEAVQKMPTQSYLGQRAASDMLHRLLDYLKNDNFKRIAVWGMGGVGKTTLVKNLNNELLLSLNETFDMVIWVDVSKDLDLQKIQSQIAQRLKLVLEAGETTHRRAYRLHQRLMMRKKLLLILDDVWDKIDLDTVGIPQGDDCPCCKILLTTRSFDVCRKMRFDADIRVDVLSQEDAWNLFAESAGNVVALEGIESLAREIAKQCCGLPLAIKTLGTSMRDTTKIELWKNALCQMQRSAPFFNYNENEVFLPLSLSYTKLQSKILQQCFLYCSLYSENFSIQTTELIQCWVADGLINQNQSVEESFNNGLALVESLKDSCLLDHDEVTSTVKLHNIVRDVAVWLSQQEEDYGFSCQSDFHLHEIPKKLQKSLKRVSFMRKMITKLPNRLAECSNLTVLFLQDNPIKKIPDEFFQELPALRVLNLSGTQITSLPPSLLYLGELRALLLGDCCSLEKLPALEALCKLQVLDLHSTRVRELPRGIGNLSNLRELNLSRTNYLEKIEAGTISGLTSLETLDMSFSAYNWEIRYGSEQKPTFDELLSLEHLSVLHLRLDTVNFLASTSAWLKKLKRFNIQISPRSCDSSYVLTRYNEKKVVLRGLDLEEEELKGLLGSASALEMVTCGATSSLSEVVAMRGWCGLASLKSLNITSCDWMTNLIWAETLQQPMLPNLEHLVLNRLRNLRTILKGISPRVQCLGRLKTVEVVDCPRVNNLISYALLRQVQNLEEIKLSGCEGMKCIIKQGVRNEILPKLRVIEARDMINLRTICSGKSVWPVLSRVEVSNCPKLSRLPLSKFNSGNRADITGYLR